MRRNQEMQDKYLEKCNDDGKIKAAGFINRLSSIHSLIRCKILAQGYGSYFLFGLLDLLKELIPLLAILKCLFLVLFKFFPHLLLQNLVVNLFPLLLFNLSILMV